MGEAPEEGKKTSLGEELFLVHLSRQSEVGADDFDHEVPHKQGEASVGEELWRVHCKRVGEHYDEDEEVQVVEAPKSTAPKKKKTKDASEANGITSKKTVSTRRDDKVIHLRNRDVKLPV